MLGKEQIEVEDMIRSADEAFEGFLSAQRIGSPELVTVWDMAWEDVLGNQLDELIVMRKPGEGNRVNLDDQILRIEIRLDALRDRISEKRVGMPGYGSSEASNAYCRLRDAYSRANRTIFRGNSSVPLQAIERRVRASRG